MEEEIRSDEPAGDHDLLLAIYNNMRSYCETHHFKVFYATSPDERLPEIIWDVDEDAAWEDFIDIAEELALKVIYFTRYTLSEEDFEENAKLVGSRRRSQTASFHRYIGKTGYIRAAFLHEGLLHAYVRPADWYSEYVDLMPDTAAEEKQPRSKGRERD